MRLSGLRWEVSPPPVIGPEAAKELRVSSLSDANELAALSRAAEASALARGLTSTRAPDLLDLSFAASPPGAVPEIPPAPITDRTDAVPTHDPPLAPRDEATFLLHIAAEIEHALMVQYLYAAYSLNPNSSALSLAQRAQVANWKRTILAIAKEEMAHFISVQNILISLGVPLNFSRETYPFRSPFYPFEFTLEPLTIRRRKSLLSAAKASKGDPKKMAQALFSASLNRYIATEMPALDVIPEADRELVRTLTAGEQVNRVGRLFERLLSLFDAGPIGGLLDADFDGERLDWQGRDGEWGGVDAVPPSFHPLVRPVKTRVEARALLAEIAEQGEGHQEGAATSHFQRFLAIYKELEGFKPSQVYLHPVATNPTTNKGEEERSGSPITNDRARRWAQLLNLRYRLLLGYLWHFLSSGGDLFAPTGDRSAHGWLVIATFYEMSHLKAISELLVTLDLDAAGGTKAGPPFELPYGLTLPEREKDRWRGHIDVLTAARLLARTLEASPPSDGSEQAVLQALAERDSATLADLEELRQGRPPLPRIGFGKVGQILDEGLRGFPLVRAAHDEFWRVEEVEFLTKMPAGMTAVKPGDGASSNLVKALRAEAPFGADTGTAGGLIRRMPAGRAPIDPTRIAFIEEWIDGLMAQPSNGSAPMARYQQIIDILDAAVGGSTVPVGAHGAFWRGKSKDEFVAANVFGQMLLIVGDGAGSNLVRALRGLAPFGSDVGTPGGIFRRMPAGRPPVTAEQIDVIDKWIDDGCPD